MEEDHNTTFIDAINKFSNQFYKETAAAKTDENLIMSPISAHIALALLSLGARGKTLDELNSSLHMPNSDFTKAAFKSEISLLNNIEDVTLNIANKIFVKDEETFTIAEEFKNLAADIFSASAQNINFANSVQAASIINEWVEQKTNNKIKNLITKDSLNNNTIMILINAVYFKGAWKIPFKIRNTCKKQFYITSEEEIEIDMMHQNNKFRYADLEEWDAKVLELPYGKNNVSMLIILPNQIECLKDLDDKITKANFREDIFSMLSTFSVEVVLPKFKIETTIDLKNILTKLGMNLIFDGENGDLSGLLKSKGQLSVSQVIQKAFIEVNEEGAEAAAATAIRVVKKSLQIRNVKIFHANHPFYYAIVADYKPLFVGKFVKP